MATTRLNLSSGEQVQGTLPVPNGGTGVSAAGASGNVLTSNGSGAFVSQAPSASSYSATIGDGATNPIPVTHGLGVQTVGVVVREISTGQRVRVDVTYTSTTVVTLGFQTAPASNSLEVRVMGGVLAGSGSGTPNDGSVTAAKFDAAALVTKAEGVPSSDNDTSFPTTAAVRDQIRRTAVGPQNWPDLYDADYNVNPVAYAASVSSNTSNTTSIASGITAADMAASSPNDLMKGKVALIGCTTATLQACGGVAGFYGPTWRQRLGDAVYNATTTGGPSTPWGVAFWTYNTRYVEILVGCSSTAYIKAFVDGRQFTLEPEAPTWTSGGATNKYKLDFGTGNAGRPHKVELYLHWSVLLAKIFTESTGFVQAANLYGPKWLYLGDSIGDVASLYTGDHLAMWWQRAMRALGVQDHYLDCIGGTGYIHMNGSCDNYPTRMSNASNITNIYNNIDYIFCGSWYNDWSNGSSAASIASASATVNSNAAALTKKPRVIHLGSYDPSGSNTTAFNNNDAAMITQCATDKAAYISASQGKVYGFDGTLLLNAGPFMTSVTRGASIGGDAIHPTLLGHKLIMSFQYEALRLLLESVR